MMRTQIQEEHMDEWNKYQDEMKLKHPEIFENASKIQSFYPETD